MSPSETCAWYDPNCNRRCQCLPCRTYFPNAATCGTNGDVTSCDPGYYLDGKQCSLLQSCNANNLYCESCTNNKARICTKCLGNLILPDITSNSCHCLITDVLTVDIGPYCKTCSETNPNCEKCLNNRCYTCISGAELKNGICEMSVSNGSEKLYLTMLIMSIIFTILTVVSLFFWYRYYSMINGLTRSYGSDYRVPDQQINSSTNIVPQINQNNHQGSESNLAHIKEFEKKKFLFVLFCFFLRM